MQRRICGVVGPRFAALLVRAAEPIEVALARVVGQLVRRFEPQVQLIGHLCDRGDRRRRRGLRRAVPRAAWGLEARNGECRGEGSDEGRVALLVVPVICLLLRGLGSAGGLAVGREGTVVKIAVLPVRCDEPR